MRAARIGFSIPKALGPESASPFLGENSSSAHLYLTMDHLPPKQAQGPRFSAISRFGGILSPRTRRRRRLHGRVDTGLPKS